MAFDEILTQVQPIPGENGWQSSETEGNLKFRTRQHRGVQAKSSGKCTVALLAHLAQAQHVTRTCIWHHARKHVT